jgi:hypothetical protein
LVDDHLAAVGEVPELCFPKDQCLGCGDRVSVLESQRGKLGEKAVVYVQPPSRPIGQLG